jgi:hypothetical protein
VKTTNVPRSVIAAFAVTIMLAGCGGGASRGNGRESDAASARTVWRKAITAVAKGDPAACSYFAHATLRALRSETGLSCREFVRQAGLLITPADEAAIARVRPTVRVHGDRAEVRYKVSPALAKVGLSGGTVMKKSGGRWLIESKKR